MTGGILGRRQQRGVALLLVLWACALLAILLAGFAALARTEALQARYEFAGTKAHYAAEAGIMRAAYALQDTRPGQRWIGDGRTYVMNYAGAKVSISAIDEGGKIDLNTATVVVLKGLFIAAGASPQDAQLWSDRVAAWRQAGLVGDSAGAAEYTAAGRHYGPRHGPFVSIEELQMVLGITPALYGRVANDITLWSGALSPDPNT
ncbi:MAG: general secretion pathway protein GspK, partial [Rhodanobacter sp.]